MLRLRSSVVILAMLSAAVFSPRALTAQKVDLSGKWAFAVTTGAGTGTPTVTLKQQGDSLTGHYSSPVLGEADLKGMVKDGKITFSFNAEVQGTALRELQRHRRIEGRAQGQRGHRRSGDRDVHGEATISPPAPPDRPSGGALSHTPIQFRRSRRPYAPITLSPSAKRPSEAGSGVVVVASAAPVMMY